MSVEAFVISALIKDGSPKKAFQAGVNRDDFTVYQEEWDWIVNQAERGRTINRRRFQLAFDDFEWVTVNERTASLLDELKAESGYMQLSSALESVSEELGPDNFIEKADFLREVLADVLRVHSPASDVLLSGDVKGYLQRVKDMAAIRANGQSVGISTGIKTLDAYWGGLQGGRVYLALGRPGDAKSFTLGKFFSEGFLEGQRGGMFSPEMNEDEHRARIATLLSANPRVQEELGLKKAFRNRAIMDGTGFNYKTYKRFWEWVNQQEGEMLLFTQKYRMQKMTPGYIESKINDLGLDFLIVDPIYKLNPSSKSRFMSGWEKISQITDELCDIAEMHNIPLVMSNQAHRQQGNKGDAPHKDSSFGADAPVQEADYVFGVKNVVEEKKLIIRCTKSRWSEDFRVDLRFLPNIGVMEDVSFRDKNFYNGHEDGSSDAVKAAIEDIEKDSGYSKV